MFIFDYMESHSDGTRRMTSMCHLRRQVKKNEEKKRKTKHSDEKLLENIDFYPHAI